jgi:hypothetical protein
MTERKLRSWGNWQGVLKQNGIKQRGVKEGVTPPPSPLTVHMFHHSSFSLKSQAESYDVVQAVINVQMLGYELATGCV